MVARLILLVAAWLLIQTAIYGFKVNAAFPSEPVVVDIRNLGSYNGMLPSFIRVENASPADGVCEYIRDTSSNLEVPTDLLVPIITETQAQQLANGQDVDVNVLAKYNNCDMNDVGRDVQGVVESASLTDLDSQTRATFASSHVIVSNSPSIIDQRYAPTSTGGNVLFALAGAFLGICGLVPFFKREKWPKEKELETKPLRETLPAIYPILKLRDQDGTEPVAGIRSAVLEKQKEIVLFKINCNDASRLPAFAVLTNKRYLLFRTRAQWVLRILKLVERVLDKIPFGGLFSSLVEPISETYELLTTPQKKVFHEAMGYDDTEIIQGKTPWRKRCDITWHEIGQHADSVLVKKKMWSEGIRVEFVSERLKDIFKTAPGFTVSQEFVFLIASELAKAFEDQCGELGCSITRTKGEISLAWKPPISTKPAT